MARLRICKLDEYQLLTCLKHSVWGNRKPIFKDWQEGDYLAFIIDKTISALAIVAGEPYQSTKKIWENDVYHHRIPIEFVHVLDAVNRVAFSEEIINIFTSEWGKRWGWGVMIQKLLAEKHAEKIIKLIREQTNSLSKIMSNIEKFLAEAKELREVKNKQIKQIKQIRKRTIFHRSNKII